MSRVSDTFYSDLNKIHLERGEAERRARQRRQREKEGVKSFPIEIEPLKAAIQETLLDLSDQDFHIRGPITGWENIGENCTVHHKFRYLITRAAPRGAYEAYRARYEITANQNPQFNLIVFISVDAVSQKPFFVCCNSDPSAIGQRDVSGESIEEFEHTLETFLEPYLRRNANGAGRTWHEQNHRTQLTLLRNMRRRTVGTLDEVRRILPLILANTGNPPCYTFQDHMGHSRYISKTLEAIAAFLNVEMPHLTRHAEGHGAKRIRINALQYSDLLGLCIAQLKSDRSLRDEPLYHRFISLVEQLQAGLEQIADQTHKIQR